jgi:hypothetical protein
MLSIARREAVGRGDQQIITHGTGGYRQGCRCEICRSAIREYQRKFMAEVRAGSREVPHGLLGYAQDCACMICLDARIDQDDRIALSHRRAQERANAEPTVDGDANE